MPSPQDEKEARGARERIVPQGDKLINQLESVPSQERSEKLWGVNQPRETPVFQVQGETHGE